MVLFGYGKIAIRRKIMREESIKELARSAKQRLKLSRYMQLNFKERDDAQTQNYIVNQNKKLLESNHDTEDEVLWQKVCQIMESDTDFISPISKLIDHKKYDTMDEISRQIYVLRLTDKYTELKQRYLKEREYLAKCN